MATRKPIEKRLSIWEYASEQKLKAKELLEKCKEREKQLQSVKNT
jgi:hypothetical protein